MHQPALDGAAAPAGLLRRNGVYLAAFLMDCALSFGSVGSYYRAKAEFHAGPADLGLLTLVTAGSYVISCLVFGRLSDRWGRRRLIVCGAVLDAVALVLTAGAGSFRQICLLMGLFSLGQGAYWPALEADIGDHSTPPELSRRLGRFNVAWCLGFVAGWPAAGIIGQAFGSGPAPAAGGPAAGAEGLFSGQRLVLVIGGALVVIGLAAYLVRRFEPEGLAEEAPDRVAAGRAAERAVPFWYIALILNFAAMGLSGMLRSQVAEVTGGGRSALGGLYGALFFGAQVSIFAALALWRGWHYRAAPLVAGSLAAIGGAVLCGLFPARAVFAAGCLLGGIGCGVAYYSSIYYSVAVASGRGHRGGIHEAVLGAGGAVVPFLGGLLGASSWARASFQWTPGVPFLFAAAIVALGFLAGLAVYLRLRSRAPDAPDR